MAEQTSWTKPGRVSSIEREPPPMVSLASYTRTERPARAIVMAAARPFGPAPTTIASYFSVVDMLCLHGTPRRASLLSYTFAALAPYPTQRGTHSIYRSTHGGIMPDIFRVYPLNARVYTNCLHVYRLIHAHRSRKRLEGVQPEFVFLFIHTETEADFVDGIVGTHQHLGLRYDVTLFFKGAEGDPAGEDMPLWGHQCERFLVRIQYQHAGGEPDTAC